ncbi:MAG TPA: hypothetical protein VJR90_00830 [Gammaproteobacteria bacterium]|nr:hypothetical protein [Gammaproteobacteria bacterium]
METVKSTVVQIDEKHFISIELKDGSTLIPLSEDKADDVKSAFNKLILRMKTGEFQIKLENLGDDLFTQVANEYIKQLNREIKEVYAEMKQYGLTN